MTMTLKIEVKSGDAAMSDTYEGRNEMARILRQVAEHLDNGADAQEPRPLHDYNGNKCGHWSLKGKRWTA